MRNCAYLLLIVALACLAGCSWSKVKRDYDKAADFVFDIGPTSKPLSEEDETPIISLNYEAADELASDLGNDLDRESPIRVFPFVNVSWKADPSPFGRAVAEQVAARLAQRDFNVIMASSEPQKTPAPAPDPTPNPGEANATAADFLSTLGKSAYPQTQAEMNGNYLIGADVIYLSASVTDSASGAVFSGWQWTLPVNKNTMTLLPQLRNVNEGLTPTVQRQF
ncbi:MAG: FlgO family outer membrane protein [Desulfovibrio sp.]